MTLFNFNSYPGRTWDAGKVLILDIFAFAAVWLTPVIGRLIGLPFYMIEPMRLMVVLSIAHTSRGNSYFLAATLPLFSWAVTGHPEFYKMLVITVEIGINVFLFYYLLRRIDSILLSMIISIVISKVLCYALYLVSFSMMFIREEAEPSFMMAQVITTLVFSFYVVIILQKKKPNHERVN